MERRELSAADIYCKFAAQLDGEGFRLYRAAQRITGFQPYDAFPYEDNRGAFEAADGHTLLRYLEAAHFDTKRRSSARWIPPRRITRRSVKKSTQMRCTAWGSAAY